MPQPGEEWSPGMINLFPLAFPSAISTNAMPPSGSNNSLELLNACSSAPDSWIVGECLLWVESRHRIKFTSSNLARLF